MNWVWSQDGWIVAAAALSAVSAALLGNFLVLRRMSMLGDAISHAVLPGLAAAFLITGSRHSGVMFIGAVVTGVLTAALTQWIRNAGKVDEGAAMGVVFTSLFALGLVLIVQAADRIDLDPGCVLYGNLVTVPLDTVPLVPAWLGGHPESGDAIQVPVVVLRMTGVLVVNVLFVGLLFKELRVTSFDPDLATTMGFSAPLMHYLLMTLVAVTAVASFESVGNVLAVAMLVVPAAAASLITGSLSAMIGWSLLIALASAVLGHVLAIAIPLSAGWGSTSTPGMMAVVAGILFGVAWLVGPRQGVLLRWIVRQRLGMRILREDLLALAWRWRERGAPATERSLTQARELLGASRWASWLALSRLRREGLLVIERDQLQLTPAGVTLATGLVRSHRLWEQYLVSQADVDASRAHPPAERLEHYTTGDLRQRLEEETAGAERDPHGAVIPPEPGQSPP
jgi:manganese/zinc/iron transport system permease protein